MTRINPPQSGQSRLQLGTFEKGGGSIVPSFSKGSELARLIGLGRILVVGDTFRGSLSLQQSVFTDLAVRRWRTFRQ